MAARKSLTRSRWNKALAAFDAGRWAEGEACLASVCKADPSDVAAWLQRSEACRRLGRHEDAIRFAEIGGKLSPGSASAAVVLGKACYASGDMARAQACWEAAGRLSPRESEAPYLLANIKREMGRLQEAVASYRDALEIRPDFVEAMANLGASLISLGKPVEALPILQKALALRPDAAPVLCSLAVLQEQAGMFEEALSLYRRALHVAPGFLDAVKGAAQVLERFGRLEEASELLAPALRHFPGEAGVALVAAKLARREGRVDDAIAMLARVRNFDGCPDALMFFGQLLDQRGRFAEAMSAWRAGQARFAEIDAAGGDGGQEAYLARVQRLSNYLQSGLGNARGPVADKEAPVFLLGFPRSGTTLLEQALDRHPRLQAMEEKGAATAVVAAFEEMVERRPDGLSTLDDTSIVALREIYWSEVGRYLERVPGTRLVDKMPLNTVNAHVLWRIFPNAHFILALRHPCDVCLSCYMQGLQLKGGRGDYSSLAGWAALYAAVLGSWLKFSEALPMVSTVVRYEELVVDFEGGMRALFASLGEDSAGDLGEAASAAGTKAVIGTPSYFQVTQPIYTSARYRWLKYRADFEPVLPLLSEVLVKLGYSADAEA